MSSLLDTVRQKYPQYADKSDEDLALAIGNKYPTYLESDEDFKKEFSAAHVKHNRALGDAQPVRTPNVLDIWKKNLETSPVVQAGEGVTEQLGQLSKAIPADIAAVASNSPQFGGNIAAATKFNPKPLPIDTAISDAAKESKFRGETPVAATLANISEGLASTAPMIPLLGGLPAAAQKTALALFTAKMVADTPEIATQLGTEFGKPEQDRDYDKIAKLTASAIQTVGFTAAGGLGLKRGAAPETDLSTKPPPKPPLPTEKPLATIGEQLAAKGIEIPHVEPPKQPAAASEAPKPAQTPTEQPKPPTGVVGELRKQGYDVKVWDMTGVGRQLQVTSPEAGAAKGMTVYVPENATLEEVNQRLEQKRKEFEAADKKETPDQQEALIKKTGALAIDVARREEKNKAAQSSTTVQPPQSSEAIPLGLNRPERTDPSLAVLSEQEFDQHYRTIKKTVNEAEKRLDEIADTDALTTQERQSIADVQDKWSAASLERYRRNTRDTDSRDLFRYLRDIASTAVSHGPDSSSYQKAKIILAELSRQGMSDKQILSEVELRSPDAVEIFKGDLEAIKQLAGENKGAASLPQPPTEKPLSPALVSSTAPTGKVEAVSAESAPKAAEEQVGKQPEIVGMGGAVPSEFGKGDTQGREVYGVAQRVREARAAAGEGPEIEPGKGIGAEESVDRGRELIGNGSDPEKALTDFEATKRLSSDDMALARAKGEELAQTARTVERKYGTESPEFKAAQQALFDWDTRTKPMQTEWHKTGQAQQGETDIDTGSFTGLHREFKKKTGKEFTPKQAKGAKEITDKVSKADDETKKATKILANELKKNPINTERQKVADAAEKELQDAKAALDVASVQEKAAKKAQAAADKVVREAAVRAANAETKRRVADTQRAKETAAIQDKAKRAAQAAADKTVRAAAIRAAKEETKRRVKDAQRAKEVAQVQEKAAARAREAAWKVVRNAARRAAAAERYNRANPEVKVWEKVKKYLDAGEDSFDEIRNKVATDLGMSVKKVTNLITRNQRAKYLADDVWKKQNDLRRFQNTAKRWVKEQALPGWQRNLARVPRVLFSMKVGFHGTVALGTHAPMVAFQPPFWKLYVENFGKMYKMVGLPSPEGQSRATSYYEMQVQDLLRNPNYITARRAGLVNDPYTYEDFNSPDMGLYIGRITGMGNRGYAVLKLLRQDMFDQQWNKLPKTTQIPEVAQALADGINHATGVTKKAAPGGMSVALFAPRLEASRAAWLAVDPARATTTFLNWKNASEGEKQFAINQLKEKAWVMGTFASLLAINQGVLSATGSKQKINATNPMQSDFLKFKVAGMNLSYGNAMLSMARLPARLFQGVRNDGKLNKIIYEDENSAKILFDYARSQGSPATSLALDLGLGRDFEERPLPRAGFGLLPGKTNEPKRLRAEGVKPYTWFEYISEAAAPIPAQEALKEVWKHGLGMSDEQMKSTLKALTIISFDAATGGRLTDDYTLKLTHQTWQPPWSATNAPPVK